MQPFSIAYLYRTEGGREGERAEEREGGNHRSERFEARAVARSDSRGVTTRLAESREERSTYVMQVGLAIIAVKSSL